MQDLLTQEIVDYLSVAVLCALGLRRLVLLDSFQEARAIVLTALLYVPLFWLFVSVLPDSSLCVVRLDDASVYCCTEM